MDSTNDLYRKYEATKQELKALKDRVTMRRSADIYTIALEAAAVGFEPITNGYFGKGEQVGIKLKLGDLIFIQINAQWEGTWQQLWFYCDKSGNRLYQALNPDVLARPEMHNTLGLSEKQQFFLAWSTGWSEKIWTFWHGETDFAMVKDFIDDMKLRATIPLVKSANKR